MRRGQRAVAGIALAFAFALAGCTGSPRSEVPAVGPDTAARRAGQAQAWHQGAGSITADLLVRVKPAGRNALTFTVNVWSPADGRIRLQVSKVGVSGFDALVEADGAMTVVAREDDVVVDDLEQVFADELGEGAALARLVDELKLGPVPASPAFSAEGGTLTGVDPATGLAVVITFADAPEQIASKSYRDSAGVERMRLEYSRYKTFDGLHRPSLITIHIPGREGEYLVRVQDLNVVPAVSDGRMRVRVPEGRPHLAFDDFLKRLAE